MPLFTVSEIITHLTTAQNLDNGRLAGDRRKLPPTLRGDLDADLAELLAREQATSPAEGGRAGASGTRRAGLDQLRREHDGGYRYIGALDESTITAAQRLQVFTSYGWASGEIGEFTDDRIISMARLAPTVSAVEAGNAAWLYPAARLGRIAAQLAIVDATTAQASGADAQMTTLLRDAARDLAATTLLRIRFFYCCATRDADQTPDLVAIGYQPRRGPGEAGGGASSSSGSSSSSSAVPTAPQNVTVQPGGSGSGAVEVGAEPPPAGQNVTGFNLYDADGILVAGTATLPVVVAGFTSGAAVTLTVRAVNAAGEGPASEPVTGTAG